MQRTSTLAAAIAAVLAIGLGLSGCAGAMAGTSPAHGGAASGVGVTPSPSPVAETPGQRALRLLREAAPSGGRPVRAIDAPMMSAPAVATACTLTTRASAFWLVDDASADAIQKRLIAAPPAGFDAGYGGGSGNGHAFLFVQDVQRTSSRDAASDSLTLTIVQVKPGVVGVRGDAFVVQAGSDCPYNAPAVSSSTPAH